MSLANIKLSFSNSTILVYERKLKARQQIDKQKLKKTFFIYEY